MKLPRVRLTVRRMMVAIASVALILGALRTDYPVFAGIFIVAGCIAVLAYKLSSDILDRMRSSGTPVGRLRRLDVILGSTGRAVAIVLASDFSFLVVYWSYWWALLSFGRNHRYPHREPEHIVIGTALGALAAVWVASRMRRIIGEKVGVIDNMQPPTSEPEAPPRTLETVTPEV